MAKTIAGSVRKTLPKDEIIWVRTYALSGNEFIVTSAPDRLIYNGYQVVPDGFKLLSKSKSPPALYDLFEEIDPTAAPYREEVEEPKKIKRRNQSTKVV